MKKKKSSDDSYWENMKVAQIKREYEEFLISRHKQSNPDEAEIFADNKTGSGHHDYLGFKKRELIKLLAGKLPPYYD
ncbi:hypothetical protein [Hahella sp. HN01]|uniref:hypothetical protein n=1 Tax=Hahella sp. HN01 TaxID=2847262 RepID=UPI001C1EC86F|nr:hypothetical protein [Hahella sp. HN01]MBU6950872.1 hypothetical protein [Hahella sp. HN01]